MVDHRQLPLTFVCRNVASVTQPLGDPMSRSRLAALALLLPSTLALTGATAMPPRQFWYEYTVKMICGMATTSNPALVSFGVVPQRYGTTINIANETDSVIHFTKGLIITLPPGAEKAQYLKPISKDSLAPDWGLATDCQDVERRLTLNNNPFFEGMVIIKSSYSLDVTAVYTVPGGVDVRQVQERRTF